jgi:phenylalanyl-tRNA synthetase beta chain
MNILIPDSWLRKYVQTEATPADLQRFLSLCGPSIERIYTDSGEPVYDMEITGNRPDSMSVLGVAREVAAILPRFGISASLIANPYEVDEKKLKFYKQERPLKIAMYTDERLNPRSMLMVFDNVTVGPSPAWMSDFLAKTGIRSLNNVVDVTNYIMRVFGQPAHVFDYDQILPDTKGIPTMIVRESKKGEKIVTLDEKTHILPGEDIVIEDGSGRLIDLCGIMGGHNSCVTASTTRVVLFLQTYDSVHIRKSAMALSHHTEAGSLFEKGTDTEMVLPAMMAAIELLSSLSGGTVGSRLHDVYPTPFTSYDVSVTTKKLVTYIGTELPSEVITNMLTPLGFGVTATAEKVTVQVPSFRRDVSIDVDVIEEIARIYGYNEVPMKLPTGEIPRITIHPLLPIERELKIRMRDWGYTELYTYSMLSKRQMDIFGFPTEHAYTINNPLTVDWVYMAPNKWPAILDAMSTNLKVKRTLSLFEISNIYEYAKGELPVERPMVYVAVTGQEFSKLKGLGEEILALHGIALPKTDSRVQPSYARADVWYSFGSYGSVMELAPAIQQELGITVPVTMLELDLKCIVEDCKPAKKYTPIQKYPASYEDFAINFKHAVQVGPILEAITASDLLVCEASVLDRYKKTITFHVAYRSNEKNLTADDTAPVRARILKIIETAFDGTLKQS